MADEVHRRVPWERDLGIGEAFGQKSRRKVVKEAAGVVGAIVPWKYPLEVTLNKLGQALATGNTVVLKPAPDTPTTPPGSAGWSRRRRRSARRAQRGHLVGPSPSVSSW